MHAPRLLPTNQYNTHKSPPGGYDEAVRENVEYLAELQHQARSLGLLPPSPATPTKRGKEEGEEGDPLVSFRPSISDAERAQLLQDALCVLYTPDREHFGIVPLEVCVCYMYICTSREWVGGVWIDGGCCCWCVWCVCV
jgi:hypothetical protein